jgi:hypothetical protein
MSPVRASLTASIVALALVADAHAIAPVVGDRDIERALKLAQARDDTRAQFHAPYIVNVPHATLERVEVVSEFRRYVLAAEEQLRQGHWLFAQSIKDAQAMLRPWRGRVSLVARLRFHPQNTLTMVPPYALAVAGPDLVPLDQVRTPITALFSGKRGDFFAPLMGATLEGIFDAASVAQTVRPVRLTLEGQEIARITIDFAPLE